jgi:integrase
MGRPRKKDTHLPPCVHEKHGALYYVKGGKWEFLGRGLVAGLRAYAQRFEAPKHGLDGLINRTLEKLRTHISPSTHKQYLKCAGRLKKLLREFGSADEVTAADFVEIRKGLANTPNMANRILSLGRQVFDHALEEGLITSNPAIGVKRLPEKKRKRLLTEDEIAAIYEHAGPRLRVIMDLQLHTGQRISDVLSIHRSDLVDEGIRFTQQKTDARVCVKWTPELREVVERAKKLNGNIRALTLLHNRRGKRPDYRSVLLQWHTARKAAKVEDAKPNDMRAVAATWAKRQGLNATKLLAHTTPANTARYLRDRDYELAEGPSFRRLIDKPVK